MLTIQPFTLYDIWNYGGATARLRIYADQTFKTADGRIVLKGSRKKLVKTVTCIVYGKNIVIPQITLPMTTNSDVPTATLSAEFETSSGEWAITPFFKRWRISHELAPIATWQLLRDDNQLTPATEVPDYAVSSGQVYTIVDDYFKGVVIPRADLDNPGITKVSPAPINPDAPVAVGTNAPSFVSGLQKRYLREFASLNAAITAIGAVNQTVLVVDDTVNVVSGASPKNIHLEFSGKGKLAAASGVSFAVGSLVASGNRKIFDGDGDIVVGRGAVNEINLAWWTGATPSADDSHGFNQAYLSLIANKGINLKIPSGKWYARDLPAIPNFSTLRGTGASSDGGINGTVIGVLATNVGAPKSYGLKIGGNSRGIHIADLTIEGDGQLGKQGLLFEAEQPNVIIGCTFERVNFAGLEYGVHFSTTTNLQMSNLDFYSCRWIGCRQNVRCNTINGIFNFYGPYHNTNAGCVSYKMLRSGILNIYGYEIAGIAPPNPYFVNDDASPVFQDSTFIEISGPHVNINIFGGQDEGLANFIKVTAPQISSTINIYGCLVQSMLKLNASCIVNSWGNAYNGAGIYRDSIGSAAIVTSTGDTFVLDGSNNVGVVGQHGATIPAGNARLEKWSGGSILNGDRVLNSERFLQLFYKHNIPSGGVLNRAGYDMGTFEIARRMFAMSLLAPNGGVADYQGDDVTYWNEFDVDLALVEKAAFTIAKRIFEYAVEVQGDLSVGGDFYLNGLLKGNLQIEGDSVSSGVEANELKLGGGSLIFGNSGVVSINPPEIAANSIETVTVSISGLLPGDGIYLTPPSLAAGLIWHPPCISASGQIQIQFENTTGAPINDGAKNWRWVVLK